MLLLSSKYIRELNKIIQRHIFLTSIHLLMFIIVQIQFRTQSKQRDSQLEGVLHGLVMAHSELNTGETASFYLQPRIKVTTATDAYLLQIPPSSTKYVILSNFYFYIDLDVKSGRFSSFISECIHLTLDGSFLITAETRIHEGVPAFQRSLGDI